ncbi:MAG TPA: SRPBCC domain-containing protein, partial [Myxococcaceae bacterium]|nr:SRPBCC domain-containing protein [Myxococcaceae bacterium]
MSKTRNLEKTVQLRVERKAVWKALTEGEEIARWFAPEARSTPGKDGKIVISWGPGMEAESPISIWEPERRLQTLPSERGAGHIPMTIDYFLEGEGGSTTLRLVHSGFAVGAEWEEEYDAHERGWSIFMLNLKHYLERHGGQSCVQSMFTGELKGSREETWPKVLRALGFEAKSSSPRPGDT